MKLQQRDLPKLLSDRPVGLRAVLVYGPDAGHVDETATALCRAVVEDISDPFQTVALTGDALRQDPAALMDAATAMSLTGGDRLVRVRGAGEAVAARFQDLAEAAAVEAFVVVEADSLDTRSKLRKLFESEDSLAALACYGDDGAGLVAFIRKTLGELHVLAAPDALDFLSDNLGGDRRQTRGELEKLALLVGPGGTASLEDVLSSIGDSGALAMEDIAYAVAEGDAAGLDKALGRARADGESPVRIIRTTMSHFQRLHQAAAAIAAGTGPDAAIAALRPPVFRNRRGRFEAQLRGWSPARLEQCLERLFEAEYRCKSTGIPDDAVCAQSLIGICLARAGRRDGRPGNRR